MYCHERVRLEDMYAEAATVLDTARQDLNNRIGICSKAEFQALSRRVDTAWINLSRVRRFLHEHILAHGCRLADARAWRPN
jgi:hypothetical protein